MKTKTQQSSRCHIFHVSVKRKKVEMPTCNTSYWKENLVILIFFFSFSSISLLLIILYKLCRKSFLYFTWSLLFQSVIMNSSFVISHENEKMQKKRKSLFISFFFQNYWKWIKRVKDKMHIFFKFHRKRGWKGASSVVASVHSSSYDNQIQMKSRSKSGK